MDFTKQELQHYARHFSLPEFGIEGQKRLKAAKVLVVGAGGLGSPVLLYLAAAGIGHIGIIDNDVVDVSNLQRQVLYGMDNLGIPKVEAAKQRIQALNPHIEVTTYQKRLSIDNILEIIAPYDIIADGTDNFPTRYLVNDACVLVGKVNVYASIFRFEGQVSVFNNLRTDGSRGPNYRDLFPEAPAPGTVPSCAEGGVLGVLPGIIGSMQANEVIKLAAKVGEPLDGRLFLFDAATFTNRILKVPKNPNLKITELMELEAYCELPMEVKFISVEQLQNLRAQQKDFQLIDVRERYEYELHEMGGELMPLPELEQHVNSIDRERMVIVHCKSGARSQKAIQQLSEQHGFENLYSLEGGILAWEELVASNHTVK
ncbi:MAG: molybdopterin-synthase adenylyltransferase MoeB [Bacteroidota bacterium]